METLRIILKFTVFETKFLRFLRNSYMYSWDSTDVLKNIMFSFLMLALSYKTKEFP